MPDNWAFQDEIIDTKALSEIKRIALLDVPVPTDIWLGNPASGGTAFFFGPLIMLATATHSGETVTSGTLFSESTQKEMQNWLEQAGIEVVLLKAERAKKSKMLSNYDQFSGIDADAILEIAPIVVGFVEDLGEVHFTEGELSPDVALAYRLITPGDNQVLIESNVSYSSFENQYSLNGSLLLGPKEHIFEDSDAAKNQPEEAARRLKYAITGATELISKVVTNTMPSGPFIKSPGEIDLSGSYRVTITRELMPGYGSTNKYYCFNGKRNFNLELKQEDNALIGSDYALIEGRFLSGIKGKIKGTLYKDRLGFTFHTSRCPNTKNGAWILNSDGLSLEGYGWKEVKWKLLKTR